MRFIIFIKYYLKLHTDGGCIMLKFDSIIRNLSLDEKISFISSSVKYQSFKVENYDLPRFEIKRAYDLVGVNNYLKISYKSLF